MHEKIVLIADDEEIIRRLIRRVLGNEYSVLEATDGEEAVSMTLNHKPDIVFMDIMMPKQDGYSACSIIKTDPRTSGIPVVMLTGLISELNEKLAKAVGADGYIAKPFTAEDLLLAIDQFVKRP